jgi:hypothetical protein
LIGRDQRRSPGKQQPGVSAGARSLGKAAVLRTGFRFLRKGPRTPLLCSTLRAEGQAPTAPFERGQSGMNIAMGDRVADEQAALRRVATLVARGASPEAIFGAVAAEICRVLGADVAYIGRFGSDASVTYVGMWEKAGGLRAPVGIRFELGGDNGATRVFETSQAFRTDEFSHDASGAIGEAGHAAGVRASVGVPIWVAGRLWGCAGVGSRQHAFPPDTEFSFRSS